MRNEEMNYESRKNSQQSKPVNSVIPDLIRDLLAVFSDLSSSKRNHRFRVFHTRDCKSLLRQFNYKRTRVKNSRQLRDDEKHPGGGQ